MLGILISKCLIRQARYAPSLPILSQYFFYFGLAVELKETHGQKIKIHFINVDTGYL